MIVNLERQIVLQLRNEKTQIIRRPGIRIKHVQPMTRIPLLPAHIIIVLHHPGPMIPLIKTHTYQALAALFFSVGVGVPGVQQGGGCVGHAILRVPAAMEEPESDDFAGRLREFGEAVESCEDAADVVAFIGHGLDVGEGGVGFGKGGLEGRFGGVDSQGVAPGEGAAAGHGRRTSGLCRDWRGSGPQKRSVVEGGLQVEEEVKYMDM